MGLTKLAKNCKSCLYVESCDHKQMAAVGFLPGEPTLEQTINMSMEGSNTGLITRSPIMVNTNALGTIYINPKDISILLNNINFTMGIDLTSGKDFDGERYGRK